MSGRQSQGPRRKGAMDAMGGEERQVQVRFVTKLPEAYRVTNASFAVPARLTRYGLSEVINSLLSTEKPKPFDFLVGGELLRTSLESLLGSKKLSAETTLTIEYIPAVGLPKPVSSHVHDDWVSTINGTSPDVVVSGCYDGIARLWSSSGEALTSLQGHSDAITSTAVIPRASGSCDVITASKDRTLRVWQVKGTDSQPSGDLHQVLRGHSASIQSVVASPSGNEVASGSWDTTIKVWSVSRDFKDGGSAPKRQRVEDSGAAPAGEQEGGEARATLEGHSQCVSAVDWSRAETIHSASWDHSVRTWDVQAAVNTTTITGSKVILALSVGGEGGALLATGGADPAIRIWDSRDASSTGSAIQLLSHKGWITAVKWHKTRAHHLLSTSHDGTVKMWDVRSKVPLHTVQAHTDKALCVDWFQEATIVSGGADNQLRFHALDNP